VLVLGKLRPLWEMALDGRPLAAVPNALGPRHRDHLRRIGMRDNPAEYFNTGVMLMDLDHLRDRGIQAALVSKALAGGFNEFADQDVFNPVLSGNFKQLPLAWNLTAGAYLHAAEGARLHGLKQYREALRAPSVVHFTQHKPWNYASSHPYRNLYLHHRAAAGWPPPDYGRQGLRNWILRRIPMILRVALAQPDRLTAADILTRLRAC
jgi:lipopolysaccharide biosynthesis glycosyltransferase